MVAIFGAGKMGMKALLQVGEDKVSCFIDNSKCGGNVNGIPIKNLDQFVRELEGKDDLIILPSKKFRKEMEYQLQEKGIFNYIYFTPDENSHLTEETSSRLSAGAWGTIYNSFLIDDLCERIAKKNFSIQTLEMLKLTKKEDKVLEIGCGSGETSLVLALNGRCVSAIDYSEKSIALVKEAMQRLGCHVDIQFADASTSLPFDKKEFDVIFQAGLLEHFHREERITLLKNWKQYGKTMVSLIPNAHSIAYRFGKHMQEENGTWKYGLELPQNSLREEFNLVGIGNIKEYTIGEQQALQFLPNGHFLKIALQKTFESADGIEDWGQGYLLVTTGDCLMNK